MNNCERACGSVLPPIYKGDSAEILLEVILPNDEKMDFNGKTIKFIVKKSKTESDDKAIIYKEFTPTESTVGLLIKLSPEETDVTAGIYWLGVRVLEDDIQTTEGEAQVPIKQGVFYAS